MKTRLIIIGASGHGKVVADIAKLSQQYESIVFLDNNRNLTSCAGYPVLGPDTMAAELSGDIFIAIGDADIRERLMKRYSTRHFPILAHPSAVIAEDVKIGAGSVIMAGAVINPGVKIGTGVIINTSSSIDHDCEIGDFVHIAVGVHLSGTVKVGKSTWIGAGTIISNNVNICCACTLGAGAVVIKDIEIPGIYIGVPAIMYKKNVQTLPPPHSRIKLNLVSCVFSRISGSTQVAQVVSLPLGLHLVLPFGLPLGLYLVQRRRSAA